jgi:hypothetical protein
MLAERFMAHACTILDSETFDRIKNEAMKDLHEQSDPLESKQSELARLNNEFRDAQPVRNSKLKQRINAFVNNVSPPVITKPHAVERIEERFGLEIDSKTLGILTSILRNRDKSARLVKTQFQAIEHYEVTFLGSSLFVIYNRSGDKIITAYAKTKKRSKVFRGKKESKQKYIHRDMMGYINDFEE